MLFRLVVLFLGVCAFIYADEVDHKVISCEPTLIYDCSTDECYGVDIVNIDGVQYFEIDTVKNTLIGKIGQSTVDIENIVSKKIEGDSYIFVGTHADDSTSDWILRVNKSGSMTLAGIKGEEQSFSIYGKCKGMEEK